MVTTVFGTRRSTDPLVVQNYNLYELAIEYRSMALEIRTALVDALKIKKDSYPKWNTRRTKSGKRLKWKNMTRYNFNALTYRLMRDIWVSGGPDRTPCRFDDHCLGLVCALMHLNRTETNMAPLLLDDMYNAILRAIRRTKGAEPFVDAIIWFKSHSSGWELRPGLSEYLASELLKRPFSELNEYSFTDPGCAYIICRLNDHDFEEFIDTHCGAGLELCPIGVIHRALRTGKVWSCYYGRLAKRVGIETMFASYSPGNVTISWRPRRERTLDSLTQEEWRDILFEADSPEARQLAIKYGASLENLVTKLSVKLELENERTDEL